MKLNKFLLLGASSLLLTGCIDNNYDLADVDTTTELKVNDLVLPLNLAPVELQDIIHVEGEDKFNIYEVDGATFYGVMQTGSFRSEEVDIKAVTSTPSPMNATTAVFHPTADAPAPPNGKLYLLMDPVVEPISYLDNNVDGSVLELTNLYFEDVTFEMKLRIAANLTGLTTYLKDLELQIPAGLTVKNVVAPGYTYNPQHYNSDSGLLKLDRVDVVNGQQFNIDVITTAINLNLKYYNDLPVKPYTYNPETKTGTFDLESEFSIEKGYLAFEEKTPGALANLSDEVTFSVDYKMGDIVANALKGKIQYELDGVDIDPVDLSDLPSFLSEEGTNIALVNPMIFLQLQNPVAQYGLGYQAYLDIIPERDGVADAGFMSPMIEASKDATGDINIMLAANPEGTTYVPTDYKPGLIKKTYENLGEILAGNGMPTKLNINVVDAQIPPTTVTNALRLGKDTGIEGMEGSYTFLAPIALTDGSEIVKTVDGWWTEDLADLNLDYVTITADAINNLPTGVTLRLWAIDNEMKKVSTEGRLELPLGADNTDISVTLNGIDGKPINNLDGIQLIVTSENTMTEPLAPTQTLILNNIRAKVTGNYTHKF